MYRHYAKISIEDLNEGAQMKAFVVRLLFLGIASAGGTVLAEGDDPANSPAAGLAEVVVTATKRAENLQDVPVAVQAVTSADLAKQGVFDTSDLNHSMPNLQVSSPYGEQQPNFSLRGIGVGTEYNANAASPVGVYVDEVYQTFRASHGQQLYDLEQVEVVRGPQGTLYGRNTTGGAINFITRQPKLGDTNGTVTVGYGNYNRRNVEGAFEMTPVTGVLGVRVAGTFVDADPYVHNVLAAGLNTSAAGGASGLNLNSGISPGGYKNYGLRGVVRFEPQDGIDLTVKGYGAKSTGGTEVPLPTGQSKSSDLINYQNPNFLLAPLFQALAPAGLLPASYSQSANGLNLNHVQVDTLGRAVTEAKGGVFTGRFVLTDSLKLIAITGFDSGHYEQSSTDCDATPLRLCSIGYDSKFHAFNQDARIDYASGPVKVIAGLYYGSDSITTNNTPDFFNFLSDVNAALGNPSTYFNPGGAFAAALPPGSLPTGIRAAQHFRQDRDSKAVYGEGSYDITSSLRATAGVRYTTDKNNFKDGVTTYYDDSGAPRLLTVSNYPGPYFIQPVGPIPASGGTFPGGLTREGRSNKISGRFILDWKLAEQILTYASYSRGYRAGTFNGLAYGSSNQVYFVPPEQVDAIEAGIKSRFFDNRLQINGAAFHYKYKGQQGQVVDKTATANLISFDGKIDGLELDLQWAATSTLRLDASWGLLHSRYDDATCPTTPLTGFPAQVGNCVSSAGGNVSVGGNPFPYAAKSSANLGFDWDAWSTETGKLSLHADTAYTGHFYFDSFGDYSRGALPQVSSGVFSQGSGNYWILNSRLTYSMDHYSISAWGKNLTDKVYYPYGIAIENLFGNGYRVRAAPLTFGVEISANF
jgi:iron complex outermembrane receptor protein